MTSPSDVQNVPDVWGLLGKSLALIEAIQTRSTPHAEVRAVQSLLDAALAQRDRFVLVPKEPDLMAAYRCSLCGRPMSDQRPCPGAPKS